MLRGAAIAVILIGTLGSALAAKGWHQTIARQRDDRLDRAASSRTATIEGVMANYENALQAARSLWVASDSVSRQEFNAFARSLDLRDRYPGLQGIGWRLFVTAGEPRVASRPAGRRPVYYVTLYSYPRIPSSSTLGADARAIPSVLATLEQARDSGATTVSNQTTLAGDLDLPAPERPVASSCSCPCTATSFARTRRSPNGAGPWSAGPPGSSGPWTSSTRP